MHNLQTLHFIAIWALNILYVQQQEFPEGDFLSKQGDFCRSKEFRQQQSTHHHVIVYGNVAKRLEKQERPDERRAKNKKTNPK